LLEIKTKIVEQKELFSCLSLTPKADPVSCLKPLIRYLCRSCLGKSQFENKIKEYETRWDYRKHGTDERYKVLIGKLEGKTPLGRTNNTCENNTEM
jgi:hypothetical protein